MQTVVVLGSPHTPAHTNMHSAPPPVTPAAPRARCAPYPTPSCWVPLMLSRTRSRAKKGADIPSQPQRGSMRGPSSLPPAPPPWPGHPQNPTLLPKPRPEPSPKPPGSVQGPGEWWQHSGLWVQGSATKPLQKADSGSLARPPWNGGLSPVATKPTRLPQVPKYL